MRALRDDLVRPRPAPLKDLSVLVVDDDPDTQELYSHLLRAYGAAVQAAGCMTDALQVIDTVPVDVLVSDIAMPGGSGLDLIEAVRVRERTDGGRAVPAIAISAYSQELVAAASLSAGFQRFLSKPVDPRQLAEAIAQVAGERAAF
jgi:CheY-like chemotaxis protein